MNVKESRNDLMFVIIRKENWIVIEFNSDNFVTFTTRCWCHNPILIDHSSNTKIVLLNFCFQISVTINRTLGIHGPSGNDQSETVLGFFLVRSGTNRFWSMNRVSAKRVFAAATVLYGGDYPFSKAKLMLDRLKTKRHSRLLPNIVKKHKTFTWQSTVNFLKWHLRKF